MQLKIFVGEATGSLGITKGQKGGDWPEIDCACQKVRGDAFTKPLRPRVGVYLIYPDK